MTSPSIWTRPSTPVWQAIADAHTITRWFSTRADVDLRPGGRYEISWDGRWQWNMQVDAVEPGRRLRVVDRQARPFDAEGRPTSGTPVELLLEFLLESRGGGTTLRLVHSGFGHGAAWDDEIDGVSHGWKTELRVLRTFLARSRGRRTLVWPRVTTSAAPADAWRALAEPGAFVSKAIPRDLGEGDALTVSLTTGDAVAGRVAYAHPGRGFMLDTDQFGGGVFRMFVDRAAGETLINVLLNVWDAPEPETSAFGERLAAALRRALP